MTPPKAPPPGSAALLGQMFAIGANFSAMVVAGGVLGWLLDHFVPATKPWGIVGGLIAGLSLGMMQFIRDAKRAERTPPPGSPRG